MTKTCEHCGTDEDVRWRKRYHEEPIALCRECYQDLVDTAKERMVP